MLYFHQLSIGDLFYLPCNQGQESLLEVKISDRSSRLVNSGKIRQFTNSTIEVVRVEL